MATPILISSFEAFGGESSNNSQLVMEGLVSRLQKQGIEAEGLVLPVVYDKAAEELQTYVERAQFKFKRVLSLGEARSGARIESQAHNWDKNESTADNNGEFRKGQLILQGESEWVALSPWWIANYERSKPEIKEKISFSKDAGNFVCNNTAFRMAVWARDKKIDYSFIHVPADKKNVSMVQLLDLAHAISQIYRLGLQQEATWN